MKAIVLAGGKGERMGHGELCSIWLRSLCHTTKGSSAWSNWTGGAAGVTEPSGLTRESCAIICIGHTQLSPGAQFLCLWRRGGAGYWVKLASERKGIFLQFAKEAKRKDFLPFRAFLRLPLLLLLRRHFFFFFLERKAYYVKHNNQQ